MSINGFFPAQVDSVAAIIRRLAYWLLLNEKAEDFNKYFAAAKYSNEDVGAIAPTWERMRPARRTHPPSLSSTTEGRHSPTPKPPCSEDDAQWNKVPPHGDTFSQAQFGNTKAALLRGDGLGERLIRGYVPAMPKGVDCG